MYDFGRLVRKYSSPFELELPGALSYDGGDPVRGEPQRRRMAGAILPLKASKLYQAGGTLTARDRQLYTLSPIPGALEGAAVLYQGCRYRVEQEEGYTDFSNVSVYLLRWVGGDD